jgi:mannose/fructose/N-acetylgalactosamine-specific phosphotransferase system component IIC
VDVHDAQLILVLSLVAGALALDETAALQVMLSQPLVAAAAAGLVVGDLGLGLAVGATLQLVWSGVLPVGGTPFPDGAVAGVVGVGTGVILSAGGAGLSLAGAVFGGLASGFAGQRAVALVRRSNVGHSERARAFAERSDTRGVTQAVALGMAGRFLAGVVTAGAFLVAAWAVGAALFSGTSTPAAGQQAMPTLLWAAPVACAAFAASSRGALERLLLAAGFAAGMAVVGAF